MTFKPAPRPSSGARTGRVGFIDAEKGAPGGRLRSHQRGRNFQPRTTALLPALQEARVEFIHAEKWVPECGCARHQRRSDFRSRATANRRALEQAGVEFIDGDQGGPGVQLREAPRKAQPNWPDDFFRPQTEEALPTRVHISEFCRAVEEARVEFIDVDQAGPGAPTTEPPRKA
jgi:hypothetical protein